MPGTSHKASSLSHFICRSPAHRVHKYCSPDNSTPTQTTALDHTSIYIYVHVHSFLSLPHLMIALPHRPLPLIMLMTWSYLRCSRASLNMYSATSTCEGVNNRKSFISVCVNEKCEIIASKQGQLDHVLSHIHLWIGVSKHIYQCVFEYD